MALPDYTLRYTPWHGGQVILNDPRLDEAFEEASKEATITITPEELAGKPGYVARLFYDESDATNPDDCNIICWDRSLTRAIRMVLGWHYGSHELVAAAYNWGKSFEARAGDDLILTDEVTP